MQRTSRQKTCWILTNAYQGTINQATGLGEALAAQLLPEITLNLQLKVVKLRPLWYYTAPYFSWFKRYCWDASFIDLSPPWPDYVIACGRQSVLPALFIKEQWEKEGGDGHKLIFLQNPLAHHKQFDVIVCPTHDRLFDRNVYPMIGATHLLTEEKLKNAQNEFAHVFQDFSSPKIAVILGGPNKYYTMDVVFAENLCVQLKHLQNKYNASLLITTSRRTPRDVIDILKTHLTQQTYLYVPGESKDKNPYLGLLVYADAILVSCESISMVSEACFTTKPVGMIPLLEKKSGWLKRILSGKSGGIGKFHRFQRDLMERGRVEWFRGDVQFGIVEESLSETDRIVGEMKKDCSHSRRKCV